MTIETQIANESDSGAVILTSAEAMRGKIVLDRGGDKLGTIDKLILDERSGQIAYVILTSGGFLGLGQSYHPVPWVAFRYNHELGGYIAAIDKQLLEGAPSYRLDNAPLFNMAYGQRVSDYFKMPLSGELSTVTSPAADREP